MDLRDAKRPDPRSDRYLRYFRASTHAPIAIYSTCALPRYREYAQIHDPIAIYSTSALTSNVRQGHQTYVRIHDPTAIYSTCALPPTIRLLITGLARFHANVQRTSRSTKPRVFTIQGAQIHDPITIYGTCALRSTILSVVKYVIIIAIVVVIAAC